MADQYDFQEIGRLPASDDNVAIATRRIDAGAAINYNGHSFTISHAILEGHRFAIQAIPEGEPLLSWGLPFGLAITDLSPGDYVCNQKILEALVLRDIDFALPSHPNFKDQIAPYSLDEDTFQPGVQVPRYDRDRSFLGYRRDWRSGCWNTKLYRYHGNNLPNFWLCESTCRQIQRGECKLRKY